MVYKGAHRLEGVQLTYETLASAEGTAPMEPAFHCRSSERMPELQDDTVTLTVTSPPYWNAIDYDIHANGNGEAWYRTRAYSNGFSGYTEYLDLLERVFSEVYRVTKPGGFCAIVIGTVLLNRSSCARTIRRIRAVGVHRVGISPRHHLAQDYCWSKTCGGNYSEALPRLLLPEYND